MQLKDHVQIFATEIDKDALDVARKGVYGLAALNDIPKRLSDQYFIQQNDGIRVIDSLRSAILFPITTSVRIRLFRRSIFCAAATF